MQGKQLPVVKQILKRSVFRQDFNLEFKFYHIDVLAHNEYHQNRDENQKHLLHFHCSIVGKITVHHIITKNGHLSTEISLLEQQEHSLNQYVEEAKARYDRTKSFRHDIRNHMAVVKKLLQSGKLEEAVTYMEDLDDMPYQGKQ